MSSAQYEPDPQVLELINNARKACGMLPLRELPQGIPETSRQCVLGRSLGVEVLLDDHEGPLALTLRYRQACALVRAWAVVVDHAQYERMGGHFAGYFEPIHPPV